MLLQCYRKLRCFAQIRSQHDESLGFDQSVVVGHADDNGLIKPKAFIVLRPDLRETPELAVALQQHVKDRLAPYKYPRWIEFVPDLPKTATGKIQRFKLRGTPAPSDI